ncbi:hypothetical protein H8959_001796 [Pygathrix nigripes]
MASGGSKVQQLVLIFIRSSCVKPFQAASLLAVLLLLEGGMFSSHSLPPALLEKVFQYIDLHQDEFVQTLKEWVAIESDSVQPVPRFRQELFRMMAVAADTLQRLGAHVTSVDMGSQELPDGQSLPIPPVILAELGNDPTKGTVCFYGHLDVQPADQGNGWLTDPYVLTEVDGKLYGRGATDNKGPVLAWINAVSAFRALEQIRTVRLGKVRELTQSSAAGGKADNFEDGFQPALLIMLKNKTQPKTQQACGQAAI